MIRMPTTRDGRRVSARPERRRTSPPAARVFEVVDVWDALLSGIISHRSISFASRSSCARLLHLLQTIEMAVHASAYTDLDRLLAGTATPLLSTHLALSVALYPVFGAVLATFVALCSLERVLG